MSNSEDPAVGLCARCRHARRVSTPRSVFWFCERSRVDTNYARYPRLPMVKCPGFEPGEPAGPEISEGDGRKK